ncbi:MAG: beta-galactosidase trimerization domain-containing protein, partial [Chloroflexota bacterium]
VDDASARNINRYVENGGNLVLSFFSGIVDENEQIRLGGYPAPFHELLGLTVEEFAPYSELHTNSIQTTDGKRFQCSFWSDVIQLKNAIALAAFEQDYYAGSAAITHNQYGKGNAFYVGTLLDSSGMEWLLELACRAAGVDSANLPPGIEMLHRTDGTSTWQFLLNYSDKAATVPLEQSGVDLLTGERIDHSIELKPRGVAIISTSRKLEECPKIGVRASARTPIFGLLPSVS